LEYVVRWTHWWSSCIWHPWLAVQSSTRRMINLLLFFGELGLGWRSIDNYSHFICGYFNYFSLDLFVFYTFYIRLRKEYSSIIMKSSSYFFIIYHTVILFLNLLRLAKWNCDISKVFSWYLSLFHDGGQIQRVLICRFFWFTLLQLKVGMVIFVIYCTEFDIMSRGGWLDIFGLGWFCKKVLDLSSIDVYSRLFDGQIVLASTEK
jgi:hypothetical protein